MTVELASVNDKRVLLFFKQRFSSFLIYTLFLKIEIFFFFFKKRYSQFLFSEVFWVRILHAIGQLLLYRTERRSNCMEIENVRFLLGKQYFSKNYEIGTDL